jgi:3-oxoacyl-[acyl-carrier-protein] synthase III
VSAGGGFKNVLVIGADALSRYVDWSDRGTCILFGDGAGAVVLQVRDRLLILDTVLDLNSHSWSLTNTKNLKCLSNWGRPLMMTKIVYLASTCTVMEVARSEYV